MNHRGKRLLPVCCLSLWLLASAVAGAQEGAHVRQFSVPVAHELEQLYTADLDGDGLEDLVAVGVDQTSREPESYLQVFRQRVAGFTEVATARDRLPAHLALAGVGRFPQGPGLVLLTPGRVSVWFWDGARFDPGSAVSLPVESVFPAPPGVIKGDVDWLRDADGDGHDELIVPQFDGFLLVRMSPHGWLERHARLRMHTRAWVLDYFRRRYVAYDLPAFELINVDGRGWKDLVVYNDGLVQVFLLDAQRVLAEREPDLEQDLQPPGPFDPNAPWDPPLLLIGLRDLNRDGIPDLVASKNDAATTELNTSTRILVFYGRQEPGVPLRFNDTPDQVYASEGFTLPILDDINADGAIDLALVNVEITFWNSIKALIARSVTADAAFYLMPEDGAYRREPDNLVSYSVSFSLGRFNHQPIAAFGDLNGDGLPDLLLSVDKERLGVHWGRRDDVWDDDPDEVIQGRLPTLVKRLRLRDLNGDGRDDLLMVYDRTDMRQMPDTVGTFTVLLSRYGQPKPTAQRTAVQPATVPWGQR